MLRERLGDAGLDMKDLKEKVVRGGLARVLGQLVMFSLRFGTLVLLARLLTPEDFGVYGMVAAFAGLLNLFRDFGLSTAMVQRPTVTHELSSTLFWLNMLAGCVGALLGLALSPFIANFYHEPRVQAVAAVLAFGYLFNAAGVQHITMLEREMRFVTLAKIEVASLVTGSALGVLMALKGFGYWSLVGMAVAAPLVSTVCAWTSTNWIPGRPRMQAGMRSVVRFGSTTTLNGLVVYVAYNFEKVLLGRFWGAEAIGVYGRAYQLLSVPIDNLNGTVGGVLFSALSRLQSEPERFRHVFLKGYSLVVSLTIPIAIAFAILANEIVFVVLGSKWHDAAPVLRILSPTIAIFALINPLAWLMFSLGLVERSLKIALVLAPLVILGYVVGLPYGPIGVATGYSAIMLVWVVPHILWCVRDTPVLARDIFSAAGKPLVSGTAAALVLFTTQSLELALPAIVRLGLDCAVLFGVHFWVLLFIMGEKHTYFSLVRGMLSSRTARK